MVKILDLSLLTDSFRVNLYQSILITVCIMVDKAFSLLQLEV